jgi:glycosyltransferase involved in cell wall biosynthesis
MSDMLPSGVRPIVSVVVPLYNTEKYIAECVNSALNQTLKDVEVLAVDDGSSDRSAEIVREIARRDNRVRLLQHRGGINLGVSRTRRLGIQEARGEYIAYLDADDAFEPSKLERQVNLMKAHPACHLCHTGVKVVKVPLENQELAKLLESEGKLSIDTTAKFYSDTWNNFRPDITEYSFLDRENALRSNIICNSSALSVAATVRSTVAATRQVFQAEDFTQWILLSTKGPFLYTPEPLTRYRLHSESSSYATSQEHLRHLYTMIEFLLTLHVLTTDPGLRARAESELLYNIAQIRNIYAESAALGNNESLSKSSRPPEKLVGTSWEHSVVELQSRVNSLQEQVKLLSDRLATIRASRVYRALVRIRNLVNGIMSKLAKV